MASRKAEKEARRAERMRREAEAARRQRRRRRLTVTLAVLAALAIVGGALALALSGDGGGETKVSYPDGGSLPERRETRLAPAVRESDCVTEDPAEEGSEHVETPVDYKANPPHSGNHSPHAAEDDLYEDAVPKEEAVHALEHGRVIVWVPPTATEQLRASVKALYDEDPYHVIVTPDPDLKVGLAATAWTRTLTCKTADDSVFDAVRAFKEKWRDKGPEFVP